ncbi:MAG: hypothetical protein JOZ63_10975 [Planctomycetaceae bacterium]|nr:hypothetical protein [Planctomycetaceae bacterium]
MAADLADHDRNLQEWSTYPAKPSLANLTPHRMGQGPKSLAPRPIARDPKDLESIDDQDHAGDHGRGPDGGA